MREFCEVTMSAPPDEQAVDGAAPSEEAVVEEKKEEEKKEEEKKEQELEEDAAPIKGKKLTSKIEFPLQQTTMNTLISEAGNILMCLSDGGVRHLLAGARANTGIKDGRYFFEVKILEFVRREVPSTAGRSVHAVPTLKIGFSTAKSRLLMGDDPNSICFDADGFLVHNHTQKHVCNKFDRDASIAVLLNLDSSTPNANTVSLFMNGKRVTQPQALPESLQGEALFPTITWRALSLHVNFGSTPFVPLPFKCHMLKDAALDDVEVVDIKPPAGGKYDVLFPVALPEQGGFDWLDSFHEENAKKGVQYTELSDRALFGWMEKSGVTRHKGWQMRASTDKPGMNTGVPDLDDMSVKKILRSVTPLQPRHYVVMEVTDNLLPEKREKAAARFPAESFKRKAQVIMGDPTPAFKKRTQDILLLAKQEASNEDFRKKKNLEKQQKLAEKHQKQEKARKAKEELKKAQAAALKLCAEKESQEGEEKKDEEMPAAEEPKPEEEEKEEEEPEEMEVDEEPPKVELTEDEKKIIFRKWGVPDVTPNVLAATFSKYQLPQASEGFEEVNFVWSKKEAVETLLKNWKLERKITTRVEDLQPGEWFASQWKAWSAALHGWQAKLREYKLKLVRKATPQPAGPKPPGEVTESQEPKAEEPAEQKEEEEDEASKVDFEGVEIFGVDDINDIGGGMPLFKEFQYEDWALASLAFELHLLAHAFKRDVQDPERVGIHLDHFPYYYSKYFRKGLNPKNYGVETVKEVLKFASDTVSVDKQGVVHPLTPEELESFQVFVQIAEEARRHRTCQIDLGKEEFRIKFTGNALGDMKGYAKGAGKHGKGVLAPGPLTPAALIAAAAKGAGVAKGAQARLGGKGAYGKSWGKGRGY